MKYDMTSTGKYALQQQENLAKMYNYKVLPHDVALNCMRYYVISLPQGFCLKDNSIKVADNPEIDHCLFKPGFEIHKQSTFPIVSRDCTLIACRYERIVIGHYGAFIEINDEDIYHENIKCKKGQEYRIKDRKYKDKVKYQWFTSKDNSNCKLYFQKREVAYADYKPDMWYISPFEVLDKLELTALFLKGEEDDQ